MLRFSKAIPRPSAIDYAEVTVSVPPTHKESEIEWAKTPPGDPNADFVVRSENYLDGDKAFVQALNAELARRLCQSNGRSSGLGAARADPSGD